MEGIEPSWPKRLVYSEPLIHTGLHHRTIVAEVEGIEPPTVSPAAVFKTVRLHRRHFRDLVRSEGLEPSHTRLKGGGAAARTPSASIWCI